MRRSEERRNEARLERIATGVKAAGVKLTHQRLEIFRELVATGEHPDAETLYRAVQRRVPTVSLDTVYRTLWMLHELGLVNTLGPQRGGVRFDANLDRHHHFVCVRCGAVRDFESDALDALRVPAAAKRLGTVLDAHVEVRGICEQCATEQEAPTQRREPTRGPRQ